MFVWDETVGGCGSDGVGSCIIKWLKMKADQGQDFVKLRVFCDNCGGQNKNIFIILMTLQQVHAHHLIRVDILLGKYKKNKFCFSYIFRYIGI